MEKEGGRERERERERREGGGVIDLLKECAHPILWSGFEHTLLITRSCTFLGLGSNFEL